MAETKTRTKKIAAVAISVVLAGTLAVSFTACGKNKDKAVNSYGEGVVNMALADGAKLNVAIGYNSEDTGLFYGSAVGTNKTFVGGYPASAYNEKPATQQMEDDLGILLNDKYEGNPTSSNLTNLVNSNKWGSSVDMATSDLSVASNEATKGTVLNLAEYLDYMPNFKAFLENNPIVYLSILEDGMNTTTGEGQKIYVAPYFDGMDDIEKGVLMRQDWVEEVLDWTTWMGSTEEDEGKTYATDDTFKTACYAVTTAGANKETEANGTQAESFMGKTGSWTIVSTAEGDSTGAQTVTITKNYSAALNAAKDSGNGLGQAYTAISGGEAYTGESGNIVDIMNAAIEKDLETGGTKATGKALSTLYREYIKVAYLVGDTQYYGTSSVPYSKVFTGYSACWDVDDLTALLRIIKCSSGQVGLDYGQKTVGLYPRDYSNSRTPDIISFVGELYGRRGATSRYEQTYIDSEGGLQDARDDVEFWEALDRFGGLAREGLVDSNYMLDGAYHKQAGTFIDDMHGSASQQGVGFMQWDYSQTQTTQLFYDVKDTYNNTNGGSDINYGWVNTPVSIWDDGTESDSGYSYALADDAQNEGTGVSGAKATGKYMRFTDSWRSVKTAGLVVSSSVTSDERKLAAALSFVDYLYSNDGQITTTYAIQDTTGNSTAPNGTWWGTDVTNTMVEGEAGASDYSYFCDETYQYVIKDEYSDKYVVYKGMICDKEGKPAVIEEKDSEGNVISTTDISSQLELYAERVSSYTVKAEYQSKCFAYGGKLYSGTSYKGRMTPTITDELFDHFTNSDSPEAAPQNYGSVTGSFTNFARYILGSTLPICVKDQSFENQMTAKIAQDDATRVSVSIGNGTINHCELNVTEDNYFYTCVPTGLPLDNDLTGSLNSTQQDQVKWETGTAYGDSGFWSMFHHVIWYGFEGTYTQNNVTVSLTTSANSANMMVSHLENIGLTTRINILRQGWKLALNYWAYLGNITQ